MPVRRRSICSTGKRRVGTLGVTFALLFLAHGRKALASDWKDALKASLEASYPLSKRASFSPDRITQQGVVLVIQKQGIAADPSSDGRYSITFVRDISGADDGTFGD